MNAWKLVQLSLNERRRPFLRCPLLLLPEIHAIQVSIRDLSVHQRNVIGGKAGKECVPTPRLINQSTADISELVDEKSIKQLPFNGRDPSSLVLLAPGTTNVLNPGGKLQAVNSIPTETGASANDGRQGSTDYLLDGVQSVDTYLLLEAPFPNADAMQEFRVITNHWSRVPA